MCAKTRSGERTREEDGGGWQRTDDDLDRGGGPPRREVLPRRPRGAGHRAAEERGVVPVVLHVPARDELAHHDGHERDRILEARAVVDRLRVPVDEVQAKGNDNSRNCEKQSKSVTVVLIWKERGRDFQ